LNRFLINIIISVPVSMALFLYLYFSETGIVPKISKDWDKILVVVIISVGWSLSMLILNPFLNRIAPWNKNITSRFAVELVAGIGVLILFSLIYVFIFLINLQGIGDFSFWIANRDGIIKFGILSITIIYLYSLINFSIYSYNQYSSGQLEALNIERKQLQLRFEVLKSQISPHFLFNALNTISSLLYKNLDKAEDFIRQMAYTYQYVIKTGDIRLIVLEKELEMVEAYFFMQKTRFEGSVNLKISIDENIRLTFIPPLALQLLVENVFKHNFISEDHPLSVEIFNEGEKLLVVKNNIITKPELLKIGNNLLDRPSTKNSFKIGLTNLKQRYSFFSRDKIIVNADNHFIVKLPIIESGDEK